VIARFEAWFARRSIRLKLTLAFAGVSAVLLGGLALALYFSFEVGLDDGINRSLDARAAELGALERPAKPTLAARPPLAESSGAFAEILSLHGKVLDATAGLRHTPLLDARAITALHGSTLISDRGNSRLLARPLRDARGEVLVVGVSLAQRDHALNVLGDLLFFGGPLMLLLSSGAAYLVAANALAPVERMRRRAAEISGGERDARLPVPASSDVLTRLGETLNAMLGRVSDAVSRERALRRAALSRRGGRPDDPPRLRPARHRAGRRGPAAGPSAGGRRRGDAARERGALRPDRANRRAHDPHRHDRFACRGARP
jgi:hypothetical protein